MERRGETVAEGFLETRRVEGDREGILRGMKIEEKVRERLRGEGETSDDKG
jgi:hypothetical protein